MNFLSLQFERIVANTYQHLDKTIKMGRTLLTDAESTTIFNLKPICVISIQMRNKALSATLRNQHFFKCLHLHFIRLL